MKLSHHEATLGIITIIFVILVFGLSAQASKTASHLPQPDITVKPYLININTATAEELDLLDGIGPAISERIIEHRNTHGLFKEPYDICNVPGIGDATFDDIKDCIEV